MARTPRTPRINDDISAVPLRPLSNDDAWRRHSIEARLNLISSNRFEGLFFVWILLCWASAFINLICSGIWGSGWSTRLIPAFGKGPTVALCFIAVGLIYWCIYVALVDSSNDSTIEYVRTNLQCADDPAEVARWVRVSNPKLMDKLWNYRGIGAALSIEPPPPPPPPPTPEPPPEPFDADQIVC